MREMLLYMWLHMIPCIAMCVYKSDGRYLILNTQRTLLVSWVVSVGRVTEPMKMWSHI